VQRFPFLVRDPQPRDFERLKAADHALGGRSGEAETDNSSQ
jgi:hypothetical protein